VDDNSLVISIRAEQSYRLGEPVVVTVEARNQGSGPLRLLRWGTPFEEEFTGSSLTVERDGEVLPYDGKLVSRGDPGPEDYLTIGAGESAEATVDISAGYPIESPGEYTVAVDTHAIDAFLVAEGGEETARTRDQHERLTLTSPSITFTVLAGEEPRPTEGARARGEQADGGLQVEGEVSEEGGAAGGAVEPAMVGGTSKQREETRKAHQHAWSAASAAAQRLEEEKVNVLYTTWFGVIVPARYLTVRNHYDEIEEALSTMQLTYNLTGEGCKSGVYAYTYFGSRVVWLCGAYMSAPETGSDTKFGTLVHEWSHAFCETHDYAYGESACKRLAQSSPAEAIMNADSHEYFVEHL
jgi:hypothetical protein